MLLETRSPDTLGTQLRRLFAEIAPSPGETNYPQRSLFIRAKAERLFEEVDALSADAEVRAFLALYDSGKRAEADIAHAALTPAARRLLDETAQARSERACRV